MKLRNSTPWSDAFLRRMVAWCCKQIDMPVRTVRQAEFRNRTTTARSGHASYAARSITVSVSHLAAHYPSIEQHGEHFADPTEALVAVTAHECYHLAARFVPDHRQRTRGGDLGSSEPATRAEEVRVLRLFRASRDSLLAEWSTEPARVERPKATAQEKRAAKAVAALDRWQRKAKLAATKVKQYRRKVAYYERALGIAAKSQA